MSNIKGSKLSESHKLKISLAHKGKKYFNRKLSEDHKKSIGLARKNEWAEGKRKGGWKLTPEQIEKARISHLNKKLSIEHRIKLSKAKIGKYAKEKHWNWQGGIGKVNLKERGRIEYRLWREAVFKRDNWACIWCGIRFIKGVTGRVLLEADHIKPFALYPELRFAIDNGRTLCRECHLKTDTYGGRTKKN